MDGYEQYLENKINGYAGHAFYEDVSKVVL